MKSVTKLVGQGMNRLGLDRKAILSFSTNIEKMMTGGLPIGDSSPVQMPEQSSPRQLLHDVVAKILLHIPKKFADCRAECQRCIDAILAEKQEAGGHSENGSRGGAIGGSADEYLKNPIRFTYI